MNDKEKKLTKLKVLNYNTLPAKLSITCKVIQLTPMYIILNITKNEKKAKIT